VRENIYRALIVLAIVVGAGSCGKAFFNVRQEMVESERAWRHGPCENFRQEKIEDVPARCYGYYANPSVSK
jgi:hypothetical protein